MKKPLKPLMINIYKLPKKVLQEMPPERLSALLLLGVFFNEAVWLRRLLIQSTFASHRSADPEPTLNLPALESLVIFLGTILVGKIHEGKHKIVNFDIKMVYGKDKIPEDIRNRKNKFCELYKSAKCEDIRNNLSFHYNYNKNQKNGVIEEYMENFHNGDVIYQPKSSQDQTIENTFICVSHFLLADKLHGIMNEGTFKESIMLFYKNTFELSAAYCQWCYGIIRHILSLIPDGDTTQPEEMSIDSLAIDDFELYFFTHPPANSSLSKATP